MKPLFSKQICLSILLSCSALSSNYDTINMAYLPDSLINCLVSIDSIVGSHKDRSTMLQDMYLALRENRNLMSEKTIHQCLNEVLMIIKQHKDNFSDKNEKKLIKAYLKNYLDTLENKHLLLPIEGNETLSLPISLIMLSLKKENSSSSNFDIIQLSNDLRLTRNIILSGSLDDDLYNIDLESLPISDNKATISFNANEMSNQSSSTPNTVFGTGVSSTTIATWAMRSALPQRTLVNQVVRTSPISITFPIPKDFKKKKDVSITLHFLIQKNFASTGNARIQIQTEYMHNDSTFNVFNPNPHFTATYTSKDFKVSEPSSSDSVKHIKVRIPVTNGTIRKNDLAIFSITRIAPKNGPEYADDIYLAAATFDYNL